MLLTYIAPYVLSQKMAQRLTDEVANGLVQHFVDSKSIGIITNSISGDKYSYIIKVLIVKSNWQRIMGHSINGIMYLYPEEALYLLSKNSLIVFDIENGTYKNHYQSPNVNCQCSCHQSNKFIFRNKRPRLDQSTCGSGRSSSGGANSSSININSTTNDNSLDSNFVYNDNKLPTTHSGGYNSVVTATVDFPSAHRCTHELCFKCAFALNFRTLKDLLVHKLHSVSEKQLAVYMKLRDLGYIATRHTPSDPGFGESPLSVVYDVYRNVGGNAAIEYSKSLVKEKAITPCACVVIRFVYVCICACMRMVYSVTIWCVIDCVMCVYLVVILSIYRVPAVYYSCFSTQVASSVRRLKFILQLLLKLKGISWRMAPKDGQLSQTTTSRMTILSW
jgi:hypothetical protein